MAFEAGQGDAQGGNDRPVRVILFAVASVIFLASLGQTSVSTAMPVIAADLDGVEHVTWLITAYLMASTIAAPIAGKLGDIHGRKRVLQAGILIFVAGSLIGGLAQSMAAVSAGRAVQGLGAGALIVVSMAVVGDVLPARERGKAQGMVAGMFGISTVIGPLIGGFLVDNLNWHWIFFVNLPVGLAALAVLSVSLPSVRQGERRVVDYGGAAALALLLAAVVLIVNLGGVTLPWLSGGMAALAAVAALGLAAFVRAERRAADPVLPLCLFGNRNFVVVNAAGLLVGIAMFGTITFTPIYLQVVQGVSPTASGLLMVAMMAGLISASLGSGQVMSRTGRYRMLPILSTLVLTGGMLLLSTLSTDTPLWQVVLYLLIVGLGIGPVLSIGVAAVQNSIPVSLLGVGTASVNMFRMIGGAVGTAALGAVFAAGLIVALGPQAGAVPLGSAAALGTDAPEGVAAGYAQAIVPVYAAGAVAAFAAFLVLTRMREVPLGARPEAPAPAPAE
ncbi:MAG: drug resistance transporter, EmrB/QacA subfamily [Rhodobacteraceae bacterium HLUCCA24]|nr:MAG: drug resistance transporter, EmrB/QacA subfamily [Rhodobacteraceae bacterium HLUCCA24]